MFCIHELLILSWFTAAQNSFLSHYACFGKSHIFLQCNTLLFSFWEEIDSVFVHHYFVLHFSLQSSFLFKRLFVWNSFFLYNVLAQIQFCSEKVIVQNPFFLIFCCAKSFFSDILLCKILFFWYSVAQNPFFWKPVCAKSLFFCECGCAKLDYGGGIFIMDEVCYLAPTPPPP